MTKLTLALLAGVVSLVSAADPVPVWTHNTASPIGPRFWGAAAASNATCGATSANTFVEVGKKQTPINIEAAKGVQAVLPALRFRYRETPLEIENTGHVVEVPYASGSYLRIGSSLSDSYQLAQFHFHTPSEHTIDGKQYDAELHLVHTNVLGEIAVVGVLLSKSDDAVAGVFDDIMIHAPVTTGTESMDGATVDARVLLPGDHSFYTYTGSLTTPPCTESVRWFVMAQPVPVTNRAIQQFHSIVSQFPGYEGFQNNNRPVAPLNGRAVLVVH